MSDTEREAIRLSCMVFESKPHNRGFRFPRDWNWLRYSDDYKGWIKLAKMVLKLKKNQKKK